MGFGTQIINRMVGAQALVVVFTMALIIGVPMPSVITSLNQYIDRLILSVAVDLVTLPPPKTPITIIHVPDIEYDAWLADIAGADELIRLIEKAELNDNTALLPELANSSFLENEVGVEPVLGLAAKKTLVLGIVAEEPLNFIQGRAEKLISTWSQDDGLKPKSLKSAFLSAVTDREVLIANLRERAVVGMHGRVSSGGDLITYKTLETPYLKLPSSWVRGLWPLNTPQFIEAGGGGHRFSSPLEHFLLPSDTSLNLPLFVSVDDELRESFILRFLRKGFALQMGSDTLKSLPDWQQGESIKVANGKRIRELSVGFDGAVVPLYGITGMQAPTAQLTLAAAQRGKPLNGWVLLGRNESNILRATAQSLAAVGDGAYLIKPVFFPLLRMGILIAILCFALMILPNVSVAFFILSGIFVFIFLMTFQVLMPGISHIWLPFAELMTASLFIYLLCAIVRFKKNVREFRIKEMHYWALQSARLNYENARYDQASVAIQKVPFNKSTLKWYYLIANALLENNSPTKALPLWQLLHKKARSFRDVKQKINMCEKALAPLEKPTVSPEKTQIVCVTSSIEKLGRYKVQSVLGHGGSGVVYRGYDPVISREVALKTLNLNVFSLENQAKVKNRFLTEVKTIGKLSHPNIVSIYDVGQQDNWAYIAMDLARGKPLTDYLAQGELLPIAEVYWIGLKVAEALVYAHQNNVVHCDIKPGNIIYDKESFDVKVTDFGIAKWLDEAHTETGEIMGSPLYMAPEQLQGRPVAEQTDLFSLGATLYQLLTGEPPFNGRSIAEIQQAVLHSRPTSVRSRREHLPASAARIVNRALKKKTSERFGSASDMAFTLNKAIIRDFKDQAKEWRLM